MNWYDEKADNPPLARRGVPNCEMSRAVGPLRVARQHGPHWRRASGQPLSRSYCEVLTSTNRSSQRQAPPPGQCYRWPPGGGMGSSKHFRFVLQWRQPFLSASILKPFGGSGSLPASGTLQDGHGIPAPPHRRACAPFQIQSWWSSGRYGSFFNRRGDAADNSRALPRPRNRD